MNLYTPEYEVLQKQLHLREDYGISGQRYAEAILRLAKFLKTESILDYGCGKCSLAHNLPFPIHNYDPFIPKFAADPEPADIVVCTDVMEHVEEEFVDRVLAHIASLTLRMAFFQIATRPASKLLADGRNAHITLHNSTWWLYKLLPYFSANSFQELGGGFIFICDPEERK